MRIYEFLEQQIEVLAMVHYGRLKQFNCQSCEDIPEIRKEFNCDLEERDEPVAVIRGKEFYACPIALIPDIVFDFYDKYAYQNKYKTNVEYEDQDYLYWWMEKTYERYKIKYEEEVRKEEMDNHSKKMKKRKPY